jgi:predicted amidohydrolase YtcJ
MHFSLLVIFMYLILCIFSSCKTLPAPADLVLLNGKILTLDEQKLQAQAIALRDDKILIVGSTSEVKTLINDSTRVVELDGKLVIPAFIDGHAHFMDLGYTKLELELGRAASWNDMLAMIKEAAGKATPGEWILGHGWHQEKWGRIPEPTYEGYPVHNEISRISPANPVYLTHASGHAVLVNQLAMQLAGIDKNSKDPAGGRIVRTADGQPSGVFLENADYLINAKLQEAQNKRSPVQIEQEKREAFKLAQKACLENGIATFHDAGASFRTIEFFKKMLSENQMNIRLWVMIGEENDSLKKNIEKYKIINIGDHRLTVRSIKRFMDGALGARGAWLFEPYTDLPSSTGLNSVTTGYLAESAEIAIANGFQLCTHAIGDRGNHETLNIYESIFTKNTEKKDLRWRIEHAQHLHPDDIPRFAQLGVIASMQPNHSTSDGTWVPKRLGDARSEEGAYVWQKLIKAGAMINSGTDAPVEDINPLANFYAAVTRRLPGGTQFYPQQCLTRQQALRSYTINNAFAAFEEDIKGTLTAGKLGDITILSKDIMTCPEEEIRTAKVLYTIVGGKIMYEAEF